MTRGKETRLSGASRLDRLFFDNDRVIFVLYVLTVIVVSVQALLGGPWRETDIIYNQYNNYIIFKQSYFHLTGGQDLYAWHLGEHYDLFKYSPAFALFFGVFAYLPDSIGLVLWNLLNALCFFLAVKQLPQLTVKTKIWMLFFVLAEMVTSLQNSQSNALIAGLIILAFVLLEKDRCFLAVLCLTATVYIKIFGLFAFVLLLFYPRKWKIAAYSVFWFGLFALLPLIVISFPQLKLLYTGWYHVLMEDHSEEYGLSVMGWLAAWFHWMVDKKWVVLSGLVIFMIPFVRRRQYKEYHFRLIMLASVLIWVVIFNHMAESPSYIIAIAGVSIWYFSQERTVANGILVVVAFVFTVLSSTDVFPASIRHDFVDPYVIKAVPCILIWLKITFDAVWQKNILTSPQS